MNLDDFDFEACYEYVTNYKVFGELKDNKLCRKFIDQMIIDIDGHGGRSYHTLRCGVVSYLEKHIKSYDYANDYDDTDTIVRMVAKSLGSRV